MITRSMLSFVCLNAFNAVHYTVHASYLSVSLDFS